MPSREELLNNAMAALDNLSEVLSETAAQRREFTQQDLAEAVDRLMDSAAQDCRMGYHDTMRHLCPEGMSERAWARSITWRHTPEESQMRYREFMTDGNRYRLCTHMCRDSDWWEEHSGVDQPYRCADAYFAKEDPYFDAFFWTMTEDGPDEKLIGFTIDNMDVINDPPDGIDMGYHFSDEDLAHNSDRLTPEQMDYFGVPTRGQTYPVLEATDFVVISHVPDLVVITENVAAVTVAFDGLMEGLNAIYDRLVEVNRNQEGNSD